MLLKNSTEDVSLFPEGLGQTLELLLLPLPFCSPQPWASHIQFLLLLALETLALNSCFPGPMNFPKSRSAPCLGSVTPRPHSGAGLACRGVAGGGGGTLVSIHFATAPEVLIKLSLQEKQKLRSHFGLPWSRSLSLSEQLGEFHITSVPQALGGSDPSERTPSSLQGPSGCSDLIAAAIGLSGQFHGRYLFFGLDAERIFSSPAVSMETPATLLAIPLPTSCFSDQYWSLAPY